MKHLSLSLLLFIFPLHSAKAIPLRGGKRPICKKAFSKPIVINNSYICVHVKKFYIPKSQCPPEYTLEGDQCKQYKKPALSCKVGQKACSGGYCVALLKSCKPEHKKAVVQASCSGSGWRLYGERCVKTKSPTDQKCPVGWVRSRIRDRESGHYYCETMH